MRRFSEIPTIGRAFLLVAVAVSLAAATAARGQSIGSGASPGRAAYRPPAQWNNGPFYTAPHVNPYAPHRDSTANLYASEPQVPPYSTAPHGQYGPFYPGHGALYPYAEGFSPYSGFAGWYRAGYGVNPTRDTVIQARRLFFRSAPRPPAGVLPPLPPAPPAIINVAPTNARPIVPRPRAAAVPASPRVEPPNATIPIYRSSVAGMR